MRCRRRSRWSSEGLVAAWVMAAALAMPLAAPAADADLAVVTHPGVAADDLSQAELKKILLGDRRFWQPGQPVTLLIQAPVSWERDFVIGQVMGMTEAQFRQYWISKVFRAEATAGPKVVLSNEMAMTLISKIPGALAFVPADQVPDGVKVMKVDGALPGSDDYPL